MDASLNNANDTNNPFVTTNGGAGDFIGQKNVPSAGSDILGQKDAFLLNLGDGFTNKHHDNEEHPTENDFFDRTTNGKRHAADEFDEDDDDFGPETDVDAVDEAILSPTSPKDFNEGLANNNAVFAEKTVFNDNFMDQFLRKDNEDEKVDLEEDDGDKEMFNPDVFSSSTAPTAPAAEIESKQEVNKFDTDSAPREETPTPPAESVHEASGLVDNVADSGDDSEDEWNYFKGDSAEKKTIKSSHTDKEVAELTTSELDSDTMSQLNPNAAEFVPVSPKRNVASPAFQNWINDQVIAQSPKRDQSNNLDLNVPNPQEFENEVKSRPSDLSSNGHEDESHKLSSQEIMEKLLNGKSIEEIEFQPSTPKKTFNPDEFHFGPNTTPFATPGRLLDQSEALSTKANFGDETSASYMEDKELDSPFVEKEPDPMSTSFYQEKESEIDLNKVQMLPDEFTEDFTKSAAENNSLFNETLSDLPEHDPCADILANPLSNKQMTDLDNSFENQTNNLELDRKEAEIINLEPQTPEVVERQEISELETQLQVQQTEISKEVVEPNEPICELPKSTEFCDLQTQQQYEIIQSPEKEVIQNVSSDNVIPESPIQKSENPQESVTEILKENQTIEISCMLPEQPDKQESHFPEHLECNLPQNLPQEEVQPLPHELEPETLVLTKSPEPETLSTKSPEPQNLQSQTPEPEVSSTLEACEIKPITPEVPLETLETLESEVCKVSKSPEPVYSPLPDSKSPLFEVESQEFETKSQISEPESPLLESKSPIPESKTPILETEIKSPIPESKSPLLETKSPLPESKSPLLETKSPLPGVESSEFETKSPDLAKSLELEAKSPELVKSPELETKSPELAKSPELEENLSLPEIPLLGVKSPEPEIESCELSKSPEPEICQLSKSPVPDIAKTPEPELNQLSKLSEDSQTPQPVEEQEIERLQSETPLQETIESKEIIESPVEDITSSVKDEIASPALTASPLEADVQSPKQTDTESVATTDVNSFLNRSGVPEVASPLSPEEIHSEIIISHRVEPEFAEKTLATPSEESKTEPVNEAHEIEIAQEVLEKEEKETKDESHIEIAQEVVEKQEIIEKQEKEDKQEKDDKVAVVAAATAGAAAVAAAAVASEVVTTSKKEAKETKPKAGAASATKKPLAKTPTPSKTASAKSPVKSTTKPPTSASPTKTSSRTATTPSAASRTTSTSATKAPSKSPAKPKTTTPASKTTERKSLTNDETKSHSSIIKKTASTTSSEKKTPTTKTTTSTKPAPRTTATTTLKANGVVKSTTTGTATRPASAPAKTAVPKSANATTLPKATGKPIASAKSTTSSTTTSKTTSATTTKSTISKTATATSTKTTTSPTSATTAPRTKTTTVPSRPKVPLTKTITKSSPDTQKQLKETVNKRITAASRVTATNKSTTLTINKTETKGPITKTHITKTTTMKSTVGKKPTEIIRNIDGKMNRLTVKNGTATKSAKIEQNGIVTEVQEITTINVSSNNSEPQLIKDLSPITDNAQLLDNNAKLLEANGN